MGEFTIFHLKQFLRLLASTSELEELHLIAHSRGTDVLISALRELYIETSAAGKDFRTVYRIKNVVLAAADLDLEVVTQRVAAEYMGLGTERTTLYVLDVDLAIGISGLLFASFRRIGQLRPEDLTDEQRQHIERVARTISSMRGCPPAFLAMRTSIAIRRSVPIWSWCCETSSSRAARAGPRASVGPISGRSCPTIQASQARQAGERRPHGRHAMRRLGKGVGVGLLGLVVTGMTVWGMGALSYSALPAPLHSVLAEGWVGWVGGSSRRQWRILPAATVDRDHVTLHNIRNCVSSTDRVSPRLRREASSGGVGWLCLFPPPGPARPLRPCVGAVASGGRDRLQT